MERWVPVPVSAVPGVAPRAARARSDSRSVESDRVSAGSRPRRSRVTALPRWWADWTAAKNAGLGVEIPFPAGRSPDDLRTLYVIEHVLLGLDEYSDVLWAVEQQVAGHTLASPERTPAQEAANPTFALPDRSGEPGDRQWFTYVPGRGQSAYWHPYEIDDLPGADGVPRRRFVQRRMADLSRTQPELLPAPTAELLRVRGGATEVVHEIAPATLPSIGVVLERRYHFARDVLGRPLLWRSRRRTPSLNPPGTTMRFDVLADGRAPAPTPTP
ncbi:hypothetical protein EDD92_0080 [Streptomyces sp. TLI_185]|nr:hypothetical protein EDD92_0080 [Streptomyces sp. TLI_185]